MGACAYPSNQVKKQVDIPMAYYLNRKDNCLLIIEGKSVRKQKLDETIPLPQDSAVTATSDHIFYIAGGSHLSGGLSSALMSVSPKERCLRRLANMPIPVKQGTLINHQSSLFHIGGLTATGNLSPVMRYNKTTNTWEDLGNLFNVLYPGAFCLNGKIYIVGGQIPHSGDFNEDVYSINVSNLEVNIEDFKLPLNAIYPLCAGGSGKALIVVKSNAYSVDMKNSVKEMPKLPWEVTENYPIELNSGRVMVFSYPKLGHIYAGQSYWNSFNLYVKAEERVDQKAPFVVENVGFSDHSLGEEEERPRKKSNKRIKDDGMSKKKVKEGGEIGKRHVVEEAKYKKNGEGFRPKEKKRKISVSSSSDEESPKFKINVPKRRDSSSSSY